MDIEKLIAKKEQHLAWWEALVSQRHELDIDFDEAKIEQGREEQKIIIAALREYSYHHNPRPLTLDELRERVGEPVWVVWNEDHDYDGWDVLHSIGSTYAVFYGWRTWMVLKEYGKAWAAYSHKPKEGV